jgi:hypothetical protein
MKPDYMKCAFCNFKVKRTWTGKDGKLKSGAVSLWKHVKSNHHEKYLTAMANLVADADREMFDEETDYLEAAGIDNIGNK